MLDPRLDLQAFQNQELEKLQESSCPDFLVDDRLSDTGGFVTSRKAAPVARASHLWEGILSHSGLTTRKCHVA